MRRPILLSVLLVLFLLLPIVPAHAEIYKWVDDEGKTHFTQNPAEIPEKFRNQIPPTKQPTPKPEESKKELGYGSNEPVEDLDSEGSPKVIRVEPTEPAEEPIQPAEPVVSRPAPKKTGLEEPEGEGATPQAAKEANVDPDSKEAVTVAGGIQMNPGEGGRAAFSGTVRNNTQVMMNTVSLVITIEGTEGKVLEALSVPVPGNKGTGFLDPAEEVPFSVQSGSGFDQIQSYQYNLKWKYVK